MNKQMERRYFDRWSLSLSKCSVTVTLISMIKKDISIAIGTKQENKISLNHKKSALFAFHFKKIKNK